MSSDWSNWIYNSRIFDSGPNGNTKMSVRTFIAGLGLAASILMAQPSPQPASAGAITIDYPAANSIFPPDLVPPTIEWRDADPRARLWVIEFAFGDGAKPVRVKSGGPRR